MSDTSIAPQEKLSLRRSYASFRNLLFVLLPLTGAVFCWWLVSEFVIRNALALPDPLATARRARELIGDGTLTEAFLWTMRNVVAAYLLAILIGVPVGLVMGRVKTVRLLFGSVVFFLFTAPKSAFYPGIMLIFGLEAASKIALGFLLAFFQVVIATAAAASHVDERLLWSARSLGTSRFGTFVRVVLPATTPGAVAGARVGLVGAIVGVFLGEMVSGASGLGQLMVRSRVMLDSPTVYVVIVTIGLMAIVLDFLVVRLSRRVHFWEA